MKSLLIRPWTFQNIHGFPDSYATLHNLDINSCEMKQVKQQSTNQLCLLYFACRSSRDCHRNGISDSTINDEHSAAKTTLLAIPPKRTSKFQDVTGRRWNIKINYSPIIRPLFRPFPSNIHRSQVNRQSRTQRLAVALGPSHQCLVERHRSANVRSRNLVQRMLGWSFVDREGTSELCNYLGY